MDEAPSPTPVEITVANAGPLIALANINCFQLLQQLFHEIIIPDKKSPFRMKPQLYEEILRAAGES